MLTGLFGKLLACCAVAGKAKAANVAAAQKARRVKEIVMGLSPGWL
jgi:hypothetical protein